VVDRVRIGILGAARIAPAALVRPARQVAGAEVVAVAARDRARAEKFAAKHGIAHVASSYEELVADPGVDAVYNPLPNGLHGRWTLAALEAGKHVLCEKPFTANVAEARLVAASAGQSGRVVMEAFHYRYHPLFDRVLAIIRSGEIGEVKRIETWVCFPLPMFRDIRYQLELAGGATMDAGCYAIHMLRHLAGSEPTVTGASAKLQRPGVDRMLEADVTLGEGGTGRFTCSMWSRHLLHVAARVEGTKGRLSVLNPTQPKLYHRLSVHTPTGHRVEHSVRRATYDYQLEAFVRAVTDGAPLITDPADAVANMAVVDAAYVAAGLEPRQPTR
jgi:predicted dehydrogenase